MGGKRTPTRKDFLKTVGGGAAGIALLGTAGCDLTDRLLNPPDNRPKVVQDKNAILVIVDTLRRDHVGAYGNDRIKTPNLDALAEESLRFTRAYPESIPTLPARRAIHTGKKTFPVNPLNYRLP